MKKQRSLHQLLPFGLRAVAVFEFAKGLLVLFAGLGLLSLIHKDVQSVAEEIVRRFHLNPAHHYPRIFIEAAGRTTDARLWLYACAAITYAAVRIAEGYGLWHQRHWAEWFAAISAGLYIPVEIYHLWQHVTLIKSLILLSNILIVIYLVYVLMDNHRTRVAMENSGNSPVSPLLSREQDGGLNGPR